MAKSRLIQDIMKFESELCFIEIHRYKLEWLNQQTETEIFRLHRMLRELKEAQNPNA